MNRDEFEQLVSQWLDEPQREDLKAALEQAIAGSDELARLRDQWQRLHELIRAAEAEPPGVDWQRLRERILSAVCQSHAAAISGAAEIPPAEDDGGVDRALAALPEVEPRVDWERLRRRIMESVAAARSIRPHERRRIVRLVRWPLVAGLGIAAAAAVWILTVLPRPLATDGGAGATGVARVWLGGGSSVTPQGHARVRVHVPADIPAPAEPETPPAAELFLMIEPAAPPAALPAGLAYAVPLTGR